MQVALYLSFLISKSKASAPVEESVNALRWVYQVGVVEDPTDHALVKQVVTGPKQMLAHRVTKKEPIATEILHKLVKEAMDDKVELLAVRTMSFGLCWFLPF